MKQIQSDLVAKVRIKSDTKYKVEQAQVLNMGCVFIAVDKPIVNMDHQRLIQRSQQTGLFNSTMHSFITIIRYVYVNLPA